MASLVTLASPKRSAYAPCRPGAMITSRGSALASRVTTPPLVRMRSLMVNSVMVSSPVPVTSDGSAASCSDRCRWRRRRLHRLQQLGLGGIVQPDHIDLVLRRHSCCRRRSSADRWPAQSCSRAPPPCALGGPIWVEQTSSNPMILGALVLENSIASPRCRGWASWECPSPARTCLPSWPEMARSAKRRNRHQQHHSGQEERIAHGHFPCFAEGLELARNGQKRKGRFRGPFPMSMQPILTTEKE